MASIQIVEVYSYTEWAVGIYKTQGGEEYQVTLTKNFDQNAGYEQKEVIAIEKAGIEIPQHDPVWKEVKLAVDK